MSAATTKWVASIPVMGTGRCDRLHLVLQSDGMGRWRRRPVNAHRAGPRWTPPGPVGAYLVDRAAVVIRSVVRPGREIITTCDAPLALTILRGWMRLAIASRTSVPIA